MISKFKGLGVAMVTPFTNSKEIDFPALKNLTEHLILGGVDYIVLLGTTGESVVLSNQEKNDIVRFVVKHNNGRVPIMVGMGGNNTDAIISNLKTFDFSGVDGILSVNPYYNKPSQKGLEMHYKAIAAETDLPIVLYNVPGRTGVNMTAQTTLKLANDVPNIIAVKEASGNLNQQTYILRDRPKDFLVLSGDDALVLPQIGMGFDGAISVVGNVLPKEFSTLIKHAMENNYEKSRALHYKLIEVIDNLFTEGNPAGVKAALAIKGIISNNLRLPLAPVSESTYNTLSKLLKNF
ncbi:MAG: 4-hydroxy-tetrahydrodipicolinate synthase [Bacteroidales bacterium]